MENKTIPQRFLRYKQKRFPDDIIAVWLRKGHLKRETESQNEESANVKKCKKRQTKEN